MGGPPCHQCHSDSNWLPGRDGEQRGPVVQLSLANGTQLSIATTEATEEPTA